jgi:hypothetical protein
MKKTFTLTENHLKLMRRLQAEWQEYNDVGAPGIDPKRPYGNSSVLHDIHGIVTGESIGTTDSKRNHLTEDESNFYLALHREMETALQVSLATGQFKAGHYEAPAYSSEWREAKPN